MLFWTNHMPPQPDVLLTEAMAKYYVLMETCSQCVRALLNQSQLYKEAAEKWKGRSEFYRPSRGNEAARARFFSAVDEACKIESRTAERCVLNSLPQCPSQICTFPSCYLIVFACSAAIQAVTEQDFIKLCEPDRCHILSEAQRLAYVSSVTFLIH